MHRASSVFSEQLQEVWKHGEASAQDDSRDFRETSR